MQIDATVLAARIDEIDRYYRTVYPYLLSQKERERLRRTDDPEFTYGVTPPALLVEILRTAEVTPDDVFFDLGCGVGHTVLTASMFCRHAYGVELVSGLCDAACRAQEALGVENVTFIHGDCREAPIAAGTVFFSYSTCFQEPLRRALAERLAAQPSGTRVITATQPLVHPALEIYHKERRSWARNDPGKDSGQRWVYYHRRRAAAG
jgi:protein-L-isoaspartate O-methyltransferase